MTAGCDRPPIPARGLLPIGADVNPDGHLMIGGCDASALLAEFGSPLYVYDEATIRGMCQAFISEFRAQYLDTHISYSCKAFASPALARLLAEEGVGMDVVSGGELAVAEAAEFPAGELNFHGNNKSREELEQALAYGIALVTVDSLSELDLLDEVARARGVRQRVLLRVSPSIDARTHLLTTTGVLDTKFGFSIETGQAAEAVRAALSLQNLDVAGVHFHLGSPIFELAPYEQAIRYVLEFAAGMRGDGLDLQVFSPGGGFAIGYVEEQPAPSVAEYARAIAGAVKDACAALGLREPRLVVEPGRAVVGRAGVALYTVGAVKDIPGVRKYVSVDGGMGDNIRPALYGARYTAVAATRMWDEPTEKVTIAGKFCEAGDLLVRDARLPRLETGDVVAVPASGAYCVSMASNYNMAVRPAIVMVRDGEPRLIRRRETYRDLLSTSTL